MLPASKITFPARRPRNTGTSPNKRQIRENGTGGGGLDPGAGPLSSARRGAHRLPWGAIPVTLLK
jgi:hypothetical protein